MRTRQLNDAIDVATQALARAGVGSPRADAELLAAHVAGADRGQLALIAPGADFAEQYERLVAQRAERVPLQHLTGTAAFGSVTVQVGPGVFIPRPETEALLEWALAQPLSQCPLVVDLCTGSAALALALWRHRPEARVIAVDDSDGCLRGVAVDDFNGRVLAVAIGRRGLHRRWVSSAGQSRSRYQG